MKKRLLPILVSILMVFTMMPMTAGNVYAEGASILHEGFYYQLENANIIDRTTGELTIHTDIRGDLVKKTGKPSIELVDFRDTPVSHTHQGNESEQEITFQPWSGTNSLPVTEGDYCLTQDVTLSDAWIAPGGTTRLCLNGHNIIRSGNGSNESDPAVISVEQGATLCLYDCGTKEHTFSIAENNPAIVDPSSGTATGTFTGGYITSKDANISGVRVEGTFEMNGGTIIGNKNSGVRVHNSGRFNLHSGNIIGNTADIGGGVRLIGGSSSHTAFEMTGGKISHNTANGVSNTAHGGGVFMQRADFSMSGGSVTNNSVINEKGAICGGGVCSLDDVDTDRNVISIGNNPVIKDNTVVGTNGTAPSNLSLLQNSNITSDFTNKINILYTHGGLSGTIGVTYGSTDGKGVFTTHMGGLLAADKLAEDIFFSDNEELGVIGTTHDGHFVAELIDKTAAPNFSPAGGKYNAAQNVTLSCATEGARIYYTTDGTEPSRFSTAYSTPIVVSSTTTIKAIAEKGGMLRSDVADATYKFPYRVVFDPGDGGSGDMNPQEVYDGDMFTFPECGFTATEGKNFYYWEMSGVDGVFYPNDEVKIVSNCLTTGDVITVTAHWKNNATPTNGKDTVKKGNTQPSGPTEAEKKAAKIALDAGVIAKSSGSKVTASWGAVKGASSYVIYANYCDQKKCKKIKTVSGKTTSFNITKLNGKKFNPKKNLKFYVVAYTTVKGKKVKLAKSIMAHAPGSKNTKRTNVTGVKVKKASFTLKKGKTAKIKAKLVLQKKSKKPLKHCAKFRYASSNKKVAKVSKKGKITAVGKGKCTVYVYAVSGVSKKIKVTVK